jgi:acyl-CoA synthetase (AMP-forming)/AMP-acid ligase II/NAD(P)-dependent dehydrogenase (short-subunit alcohol dehydrogenase family)/acyl carrier protein
MPKSGEISRERLRSYEEKIRNLPGIGQAVITVREVSEPSGLKTIPVSELVPNLPAQMQFREQGDGAMLLSASQQEKDSGVGPPAISHGGDLREPEKVPRSLSETLKRAAERAPHRGIVYINNDGSEDFQPYPRLLADAERMLRGLRRLGLAPGDMVIFQIDDNRGFVSCHWACVLGGFVPVPISIAPTYQERNLTVNKLVNTWESLSHPVVITTRGLMKPLTALGRRDGLTGLRIAAVEELIANERDREWAERAPEDVTLLLLTSGSTGKPKLVQQCHHSLLSRSAGTVQLNGFTSAEVTLNWMPLDHVGGIVMWHIRDVYLACQQIHVPTQVILENPLMWLDLIDQYKATLTWAPNFAYGLINDRLAKNSAGNWDLSSMRSILNGGEAVVSKTARRFLTLLAPYGLPPGSMQPAWGMSETCSGVTHSNLFSLETTRDDDQFVEVGKAIPGFSMRIADEKNRIVREGVIGHLQVKGAPVTSGYYNNPKANEEAFTEDEWFDTGDLGVIRDGRLTITGRGKGEIIINGVNYYSHEIESAVEAVDGVEVSFTAATAVRHPGDDTDKVAVFFHPTSAEWEEQMGRVREVRRKLVRAFGIHADYVLPVAKEDIPKTAIGKVQHSRLSKQLVEGEFDHLIRKIATEEGVADAVPNWFYRKVWLPATIDRGKPGATDGHYLIFMDPLGLGAEVTRFLDRTGQKYIRVDMGKDFAHPDENTFVLSPDTPEHCDRLMAVLTEKGVSIGTVLHLWGYSAHRPVNHPSDIQSAQDLGIYSLLALIRNLTQSSRTRQGIRLIVATSHVQAAAPRRPIAYEKSTLPGFLKTASLDLPWLQCRHIDFEVTDRDGKYLIDEIGSADTEREIAYHNGARMKPCLSSIDMLAEKPGKLPLEQDGLYLITGGLGGVGSYIAQRLLTQFRAKLILAGRTKLPEGLPRDGGDRKKNRAAERGAAYENIESIARKTGTEFVYQAADISDRSSIETAVSSAESKWGMPLSGVFHLAGDLNIAHHWETAESHRIGSEGRDAFEAMFKAKVYGTWNLFQIIKQRPGAIFVGFSSVVSELGGATFGAYCAGNSFLEGCTRFHRESLPQDVFSFSWSMWEDMGMNKGNPRYAQQAASSMGNMTIEPEIGWIALLAGLCRKDREILVGLNGLNPHIRSRLDKRPEIPKRLGVYVTTPSRSPLSDELRDQVKRALGDSEYPFDMINVKTIPLLEDGSVDLKSLERYGQDKAGPDMESAAPRTDAEMKIAAIWKEVLGVKKIRVDVNFFDSGGTSIQLAQVNGQLKEVFGRNIPMTDLFQFPTISTLAMHLTSSTADSLGASLSESEGHAVERRTKMISRKRSGKSPLGTQEKR